MSLKYYLKQTKACIAGGDPTTALEYVEDVLEIEPQNYFAFVFQGKSYQLLQKWNEAANSFAKATEIEPDNLLGWKGYFQTAISSGDYNLFFKILALYLEKQSDLELPLAETVKEAKNYLHFHDYKKNLDLYEKYLEFLSLGDILDEIAELFLPRVDTLRQLLEVTSKKEAVKLKDLINKEKLKLPPRLSSNDVKKHLAEVKWSVYKNLKLDSLYKDFINVCNEDDERAQKEEEWVKYKYDLLIASPNKLQIAKELTELVDGMVLVRHKSFFVWSLYFDWKDVSTLSELDLNSILFFLENFGNEGLAIVLYAYILSDLSPFDKNKVIEGLKKSDQNKQYPNKPVDDTASRLTSPDEEELEELETKEDLEDNLINIDPTQTLVLLNDGLSKCSNSIAASRIVCKYMIHHHEYEEGSSKCREAIRLLAENQRFTGIDLVHTREDILCSLAVVYTYHEAPKNHSKALTLYNKILEDNPHNSQAAVGKGLILIEKEEYVEAKDILTQATKQFPDSVEAKIELSWCLVKLGIFEEGRKGLIQCIAETQGNSVRNLETRALLNWRIAESYDYLSDDSDDSLGDEAYKYLVLALKESQNFAPAYTSLGVLYGEFYQDKERSQKCFYKAFELDVGEIKAAKYLVQDLTAREEWEIAEILCRRIVSTDRLKRVLLSSKDLDDKAWPYRVLGCLALNKQQDSKAVEWFQTALRMASMDQECWVGLGEAYYHCGRLDAAAKVLIHASTLVGETDWQVNYLLGQVMSDIGQYEASMGYLEKALDVSPNEECIINLLYETSIANSTALILQGFFGRSFTSNLKAVEYLIIGVKINNKSQRLWKAVGDCLRIFMIIQDHAELFPKVQIESIFLLAPSENNSLIAEIEKQIPSNALNTDHYGNMLAYYNVRAAQCAVYSLPIKVNKLLRSMAYYNLGLALLEAYKIDATSSGFRESAISCLQKALQIEPANATYWTALGNSFASLNPQVSQHCFIKASSLESRDASIWTNLAALYLRYGDHQLAEEAFLRALSVAPTESSSWLGHALAAESAGRKADSSRLFTHAYILANGRNPLAQLLYGLSILNKRLQTGCDPRDIEAAQEFSVANFSIINYMKFYPEDEVGLKIAITISERCKNYEKGIELGLKLASILEKKYEESESPKVLEEFAFTKALIARMYLGIEDYEQSFESAQFALDILGGGEGDANSQVDVLQQIIVSCRITLGLVYFFEDKFEDALDQLKSIMTNHSDSRKLVTLTAQILFAFKAEDTKLAAIDQLFSHIEEYGSNLLIALTLGAISVVENLDEYLEPIKEELEGLCLNDLVSDSVKIVPKLISEIDRRLGKTNSNIWQKNAILFPGDYNIWKKINSSMALRVATLSDTKLAASETAQAYLEIKEIRAVQRSLILNPTNEITRMALKGV